VAGSNGGAFERIDVPPHRDEIQGLISSMNRLTQAWLALGRSQIAEALFETHLAGFGRPPR